MPRILAVLRMNRAAVARDWQRIQIHTMYTEGLDPIPVGVLYLGFTSTAVYECRTALRTSEGHASAAKYVGFRRPFQAIQGAATDGNPATVPDPAWTWLIATPYSRTM